MEVYYVQFQQPGHLRSDLAPVTDATTNVLEIAFATISQDRI